MNSSTQHLPNEKLKELSRIVEIIKERTSPGMIILFGSFARGDWVADKYKEGHITYEYLSDFDILVVLKGEKQSKNYGLWNEVENEIKNDLNIKTPVSILSDSIHFINEKIKEGNYFYTDIKSEGIILYDSGEFKLAEPGRLSKEDRKQLARNDFDFWHKKARSFLKDFNHNIQDGELNNAAFHLHQVTETLFVAALLAYTGYKPKTHNIEKIRNLLIEHDRDFGMIFQNETEEQKRIFVLLKNAYTDARYREDYKISFEELGHLAEEVAKLEQLVIKKCQEKISTY